MSIFGKPLLNTIVEVMCQDTGKTFRIETNKKRKCVRCWQCTDKSGAAESFEVILGEGRGNVVVIYYDKAGGHRQLEKIVPDALADNKHGHMGLAQYNATGGTFILVSQEKV